MISIMKIVIYLIGGGGREGGSIGVPDDVAAGGRERFALKMQSRNLNRRAGKLL